MDVSVLSIDIMRRTDTNPIAIQYGPWIDQGQESRVSVCDRTTVEIQQIRTSPESSWRSVGDQGFPEHESYNVSKIVVTCNIKTHKRTTIGGRRFTCVLVLQRRSAHITSIIYILR